MYVPSFLRPLKGDNPFGQERFCISFCPNLGRGEIFYDILKGNFFVPINITYRQISYYLQSLMITKWEFFSRAFSIWNKLFHIDIQLTETFFEEGDIRPCNILNVSKSTNMDINKQMDKKMFIQNYYAFSSKDPRRSCTILRRNFNRHITIIKNIDVFCFFFHVFSSYLCRFCHMIRGNPRFSQN